MCDESHYMFTLQIMLTVYMNPHYLQHLLSPQESLAHEFG